MNLMREIRHGLRTDTILQAVVGEDDDGEIKVYSPLAKSNAVAPYVTLQMNITVGPIDAYGQEEAVEAFRLTVSSWGRDTNEGWQVADVADDAIKRADYSFEPAHLIFVRRATTPHDLIDRDTGLAYVVVQYDFAIGR